MIVDDLFENQDPNGLRIGDPVVITGNVQYQGKTGDVREIGRDGAFVVVDLYNYGPHSFHSTDVSLNDYADSDDEAEYQQGVAEGSDHSLKKVWDRYSKHLMAARGDHPDVSQIIKSSAIVRDIRKYVKDHHGQQALDDMERYAEKQQWNEGVAEGSLEEISQDTARSYVQKARASQKDLINQTYRKGADTDKLNKKIQIRQQGLNRAHTDKRYYKDELGVAEAEKNPHTSALGRALYRDLSREKKASPAQVQRNKERWAQRQKDREQGVAEGVEDTRRQVNLKKKIDKGTATPEQKKEYEALKAKNTGKKPDVAEASDISGLIAAASMVQDYIVTAEVDGQTKRFRVRGMTGPTAARERFLKHASQARVIDVKPAAEKNVAEDSLEEIDRRGFLKGIGGAALAAAGVDAAAQIASNSKEEARRIRDIADKFAMTNSAFRKEYQPVSDSYRNTAHKIMSSGKNYSPNSELARRQHAELIKLLRQEDKRFVELVVPLLKKYQVTYEDVDVDEGWKQNLAALGVAGALGLGSVGPAQAFTDPASDKIVATLVIDGEQRMLDLSSKNFSDVRAAEKFVRDFMQQRGIDDYQYVIKGKGQTARCAGNCGLDFKPTREDVAEADTDKIGDRYDAEEFDQMMLRLKKLANSGPLKTVWDPERRVYKNVPINPKDQK